MNSLIRSILLVLVLVVAATIAQGQIDQLGQSNFLSATSVQQTTSNYYYAKPNELTIVVNVMGFVQRPGRYEISKSIDLVNLLALAGGATTEGSMGSVKITRLLEGEGRVGRGEYFVDLDDIASVNPSDLALSPGDVIQVNRTGWSAFRDVFTIVVGSAVIVTAISQVIIATSYK